ncbi:MAG: hypothetical protein WBK78_12615 [Syntrophomonadaceae bacterium]
MDFIEKINQFSRRVETLKDQIQTEEATKTALITTFLILLRN